MKKIFVVLFSLVTLSAQAQLTMPTLFSDNMLLQQSSDVALWGTDKPNQKILIKGSWGESTSAVADAQGEWRCEIKTLAADNKPQQLTIKGSETKQIDNIMFGDIWFCSGQSNMEMQIISTHPSRKNQIGANIDVLESANASIRYFCGDKATSDTPLSDVENGAWVEASPATTGDFSAVAYYFARRINQITDVPVGLIVSSWGGTPIEPWMDRPTLDRFKGYSYKTMEKVGGHQLRPTYLFNAMVSPYIGFNIKGFLWYQGERNRSQPQEYSQLLAAMVELWREKWGLGELPFYYAQLAPYQDPAKGAINSAFLREAQTNVMSMVDGVGMASILDIGEETNIHPGDKDIVGDRLALWALAKDYGYDKVGFCGPIYKSMTKEKNGRISLTFDYGVNMTSQDKELTGFEVAGADKVFHPAKASITNRGSNVEVYSAKVPEPVAVRYCFKKWCVGSLYNVYDLPASSFRTDDWDDVGRND